MIGYDSLRKKGFSKQEAIKTLEILEKAKTQKSFRV